MNMWKKRVVASMLLLVMMMVPSIGLAGSQDFTLVNNSPYNIVGFWVAPADSDNWEENLMEGQYLPPDSSVAITFDNSNDVQWWNFRVKDSSGRVWTWEKKKYNLNQIYQITYYYQGGRGMINYK